MDSTFDGAAAQIHGIGDIIDGHVVVIPHDEWLCQMWRQSLDRIHDLDLGILFQDMLFRIVGTVVRCGFHRRKVTAVVLGQLCFLNLLAFKCVETDSESDLVKLGDEQSGIFQSSDIFQYQNIHILQNILRKIWIFYILVCKAILLLISGSIQLGKCVAVTFLRFAYKLSKYS